MSNARALCTTTKEGELRREGEIEACISRARSRSPVGVDGAVGRPDGAVRPFEAGVALAPGPPVLADDAIQEHAAVAGASRRGHGLGIPGRP